MLSVEAQQLKDMKQRPSVSATYNIINLRIEPEFQLIL